MSYAFGPPPTQGGGVPQLEVHTITGPFAVSSVSVVPVPIWHGRMPILGFRFGEVAYLTDCSGLPDTSWPLLEGLDVLILDALRFRPHSTHFSLDQAVEVARRVGAKRTFFTHMGHEVSHAEVNRILPAGMELAYDGLTLDVAVDTVQP